MTRKPAMHASMMKLSQDLQSRHAENETSPARCNGQGNKHRQSGLERLMACHGEKAHQEKQGKEHVVDDDRTQSPCD